MINVEKLKSLKKIKLYGKLSKPSQIKRVVENKALTDKVVNEIYQNQNYSWTKFVYEMNKENLDSDALLYRDNHITYKEMFHKADELAASLLKNGVKKGDVIPCCIGNTPELVYLMLAASKIGAVVNLFGPGFDENYISEIINSSTCGLLFVADYNYSKIRNSIKNSNAKRIIGISLMDSLKQEKDPYDEIDSEFLKFKYYDMDDDRVTPFKSFCNEYDSLDVEDKENLDAPFTITYTSGSTGGSIPKQILHSNKSYIIMGRFHNNDLSGLPSTKHTLALSHIPSYSNTNLASTISDVFFQNGTVALEPIYDIRFFYNSLMINKPTFAAATKSFYVYLSKMVLGAKDKIDLSFVKIPTVVGEGMSKGEEKLINRALKKVKAGCKELPFPIAPVTVSYGGGDCEHGGLFFSLFRETLRKLTFSKNEYGMTPFKLANCTVLKPNGKEADINELGRLVSNSPCTMMKYNNNPEATEKFWVKDADGRTWADNGVFAYIDPKGRVHIKDRYANHIVLSNGEIFPLFRVSEIVSIDTKNVLSCETVLLSDINQLVMHIEFQPDKKICNEKILSSIDQRLSKSIPEEVYNLLNYRVRSYTESFPTNGSGKRNTLQLKAEGMNNTFKIADGNIIENIQDEDVKEKVL